MSPLSESTDAPVSWLRFVVLHHAVGDQLARTDATHLDWMFEQGGQLKTFASTPVDLTAVPLEVAVEPLADHRLAYLAYEGELSDNRGTVTRIAQGRYRLLESSRTRWHALLDWQPTRCQPAPGQLAQRMRSELLLEETRGVWHLRVSPT